MINVVEQDVERPPSRGARVAYPKQIVKDKLVAHKWHAGEHGQGMPEIRNWKWTARVGSNADTRCAATTLNPALA